MKAIIKSAAELDAIKRNPKILIASSDMIVPTEDQEEGKVIPVMFTGISELRESRLFKENGGKHYIVAGYRREDGKRGSVLQSEYIPEGVAGELTVTKTVNDREGNRLKTPLWGFSVKTVNELGSGGRDERIGSKRNK